MTPEERAAKVLELWRRQVVDTTTPFSGDEVLARDIAEAIREAVAERTEACAKIAASGGPDAPWNGRDQRELNNLAFCAQRIASAIRALA